MLRNEKVRKGVHKVGWFAGQICLPLFCLLFDRFYWRAFSVYSFGTLFWCFVQKNSAAIFRNGNAKFSPTTACCSKIYRMYYDCFQ